MTSNSLFLVLVVIYSKSFLKSASGANKFISILNGMSMKLQSNLGDFLGI